MGYSTGAELFKIGRTGKRTKKNITLKEALDRVYEVIPNKNDRFYLNIPKCLFGRKVKLKLVK